MQSGEVVICDYVNFSGETKRGLFIVLYDEQYDATNNTTLNFIAIKITTKLNMVGNYTVYLDVDENPFFKAPCLASCGKIHTMHKNQIKYHLGKLSSNSFKKVYIGVSKFLSELNRQMINNV